MASFQVLWKNQNKKENYIKKKDKASVRESYQANYLGGKRQHLAVYFSMLSYHFLHRGY